jgi:antitoxin ParD1/3/4
LAKIANIGAGGDAMATMNISLPDAMKEWVEAQVATGRYANVSDFVRDVLREEMDRTSALAELRTAIQEGLDSGPAVPLDMDAIWDRAVKRHEAVNGKAAE